MRPRATGLRRVKTFAMTDGDWRQQARAVAQEVVPAVKLSGLPDISALDRDGIRQLADQYREVVKGKMAAMLDYASQVDSLREKAADLLESEPPTILWDPPGSNRIQWSSIRLTARASATAEQVSRFTNVAMPEEGSFARALNRRSSTAAGIPPDRSYQLLAADGGLIALVLRDVLPDSLARCWAELHAAHERRATLWGLGCEAEPCVDVERIIAALRSQIGAKGYGIVDGFEVHELRARSGSTDNKPEIVYTNKKTGQTTVFGIGGNLQAHPASTTTFHFQSQD